MSCGTTHTRRAQHSARRQAVANRHVVQVARHNGIGSGSIGPATPKNKPVKKTPHKVPKPAQHHKVKPVKQAKKSTRKAPPRRKSVVAKRRIHMMNRRGHFKFRSFTRTQLLAYFKHHPSSFCQIQIRHARYRKAPPPPRVKVKPAPKARDLKHTVFIIKGFGVQPPKIRRATTSKAAKAAKGRKAVKSVKAQQARRG